VRRERIWNLFKNFDLDNDKDLDIGEVQKCLIQNKNSITTDKIKEILIENKHEDSGNIDFENFYIIWEEAEKINNRRVSNV